MIKRCNHCKSENIKVDAWARWNKELNSWEIYDTFDFDPWCDDCKGPTSLEEIEEFNIENNGKESNVLK